MIFASILFLNHSIERHSSRNFPLKDSLVPFCQGFPGSMCAVSHFSTARDTNPGPLSDLRCFEPVTGSAHRAAPHCVLGLGCFCGETKCRARTHMALVSARASLL